MLSVHPGPLSVLHHPPHTVSPCCVTVSHSTLFTVITVLSVCHTAHITCHTFNGLWNFHFYKNISHWTDLYHCMALLSLCPVSNSDITPHLVHLCLCSLFTCSPCAPPAVYWHTRTKQHLYWARLSIAALRSPPTKQHLLFSGFPLQQQQPHHQTHQTPSGNLWIPTEPSVGEAWQQIRHSEGQETPDTLALAVRRTYDLLWETYKHWGHCYYLSKW